MFDLIERQGSKSDLNDKQNMHRWRLKDKIILMWLTAWKWCGTKLNPSQSREMPDIAHQSTAHQMDSTDRKDSESQRQQKIKDTLITGLRYQRLELECHWWYFRAHKNLCWITKLKMGKANFARLRLSHKSWNTSQNEYFNKIKLLSISLLLKQ